MACERWRASPPPGTATATGARTTCAADSWCVWGVTDRKGGRGSWSGAAGGCRELAVVLQNLKASCLFLLTYSSAQPTLPTRPCTQELGSHRALFIGREGQREEQRSWRHNEEAQVGWTMACHALAGAGTQCCVSSGVRQSAACCISALACLRRAAAWFACLLRPSQPPNLRPLNPNPPSSLGLQSELRTNIEAVLNHVFNKHEEVGAGRCCSGWGAGGGLAAWCRCGVCLNAGGRGRAAVGAPLRLVE